MRPAGLLDLHDITCWLALPDDFKCLKARRLLKAQGILPVVHATGGRSRSLWRWEDLQVLSCRAPSASDVELPDAA